jgi:hypothetical protein
MQDRHTQHDPADSDEPPIQGRPFILRDKGQGAGDDANETDNQNEYVDRRQRSNRQTAPRTTQDAATTTTTQAGSLNMNRLTSAMA